MKKIIIIMGLLIATTAYAGFWEDLRDLLNKEQPIEGLQIESNLGASKLFPYQGGTGTSSAPTYGQMLVGTSGGVYQLQATSTLNIAATTYSGFAADFYTYFSATTTDALAEGSVNFYADQARWDTFWNASTTLSSVTSFGTLTGLTIGSATSTASNGFDISAGCFAIGGTCVAGGTVTSVAMSVPTGLTIGGSPITTSGTLALTYTAGYEGLLTTDKDNFNNKWDLASTTIAKAYLDADLVDWTTASTTYVWASDWTTIDDYPANCAAGGGVVTGVTDTLVCTATSSLGLLTTDVAEGTNLYWTDSRISPYSVHSFASTTYMTQATTSVNSITTLSNLVTVGALNSGSITSNFGSIDIGASDFTTTGIGTITYASTTQLTLSNQLYDPGNSAGSYGNLLSSTGSAVDWIATSTLGLISSQLAKGNFLVGNDNGAAQATSTIFVSSDGNVGIGSTTPWGKLSVENTGAGLSFIVGDEANDSSPFVVDEGGNVGIGTTAPGEILEVGNTLASRYIKIKGGVSSGGEAGLKLSSYYRDWSIILNDVAPTEGLHIKEGANTFLHIESTTGNVGIGTTNPSMLFSVHGDALADSWNVYSDIYKGDALTGLKGIKAEVGAVGDWVKVDHNSLPEGILKNNPITHYENYYIATTTNATTTIQYQKISDNKIISKEEYDKLSEAEKGKTVTDWTLQTMSISGLAQMNTRAIQQLDLRLSTLEGLKGYSAEPANDCINIDQAVENKLNSMTLKERLNWLLGI